MESNALISDESSDFSLGWQLSEWIADDPQETVPFLFYTKANTAHVSN